MPVNVNEIMEACQLLARQDNLNLCIQESLKGATMAGFGSFIGGVLMGPVGIAVGATVGGVVGSSVCRQYQPLWQIIQEMNEADKDRFAKHMQKVLNDLDITDAVILMTLVRDPTAMGRNAIVKEMGNYFGHAMIAR